MCHGAVKPPGPAPPNLLVVEANLSVRLFLERALRQTKAVVLGAEHAEAALAGLTLVRPDLILMDLALPGLSGPNLARRLHQDHGGRRVRRPRGDSMTVAELGAVLRRLLTDEGREPKA